MPIPGQPPQNSDPRPRPTHPRTPADLFQIVIECQSESQQREVFERLRAEGLKVRLLVL